MQSVDIRLGFPVVAATSLRVLSVYQVKVNHAQNVMLTPIAFSVLLIAPTNGSYISNTHSHSPNFRLCQVFQPRQGIHNHLNQMLHQHTVQPMSQLLHMDLLEGMVLSPRILEMLYQSIPRSQYRRLRHNRTCHVSTVRGRKRPDGMTGARKNRVAKFATVRAIARGTSWLGLDRHASTVTRLKQANGTTCEWVRCAAKNAIAKSSKTQRMPEQRDSWGNQELRACRYDQEV